MSLFQPIAAYFGQRQIFEKLEDREIRWPDNRGPPLDTPKCGFTGNAPECIPLGKSTLHTLLSNNAIFTFNHQNGLNVRRLRISSFFHQSYLKSKVISVA